MISEQLPPEAPEQARRVLEAHREIFSSTWVHHGVSHKSDMQDQAPYRVPESVRARMKKATEEA